MTANERDWLVDIQRELGDLAGYMSNTKVQQAADIIDEVLNEEPVE